MSLTYASSLAADDAEIPVIDLGPFLAGQPGALARASAKVGRACEEVGFFTIANHGIDAAAVERAFAAARAFFDLPHEAKMRIEVCRNQMGYIPIKTSVLRTSTINENTKADLNETYVARRERTASHPLVRAGRRMCGINRWPAELPEFRAATLGYMDTMEALARRMLALYATALGERPGHFDASFDDGNIACRVSHYPRQEAVEDNAFGLAPHSDAGFITLLPQAKVPGLEIRLPSGRWIAAPSRPGTILVNSGETLARWTNDRYIATPHRVIPPRATDRISLPFFYNPHPDAVVDCIASCDTPEHPRKYAPMTYGEYHIWYITQNYPRQREAGDAEGAPPPGVISSLGATP